MSAGEANTSAMSPVITTPAALASGIGTLGVTGGGYPTRRTAAKLRDDDLYGVGARASDQRGGAEQLIQAIGIAEKIVDVVDPPDMVGDSTGSLASEAVGVQVQGEQADGAYGQLVRRWAALDGLHPQ